MISDKHKYCLKIGGRVLALRKSKGMTQTDLGIKAGCTNRYISYFENGKVNPSLLLIKKIADVLGVTMEELFNETALKAAAKHKVSNYRKSKK